jgi:hypothetical protein
VDDGLTTMWLSRIVWVVVIPFAVCLDKLRLFCDHSTTEMLLSCWRKAGAQSTWRPNAEKYLGESYRLAYFAGRRSLLASIFLITGICSTEAIAFDRVQLCSVHAEYYSSHALRFSRIYGEIFKQTAPHSDERRDLFKQASEHWDSFEDREYLNFKELSKEFRKKGASSGEIALLEASQNLTIVLARTLSIELAGSGKSQTYFQREIESRCLASRNR